MILAWGLNQDVKLFYILNVGEPSCFLENELSDIFLNLFYFEDYNLKTYPTCKPKSSCILEPTPAFRYILAWIEVEIFLILKSEGPGEMLSCCRFKVILQNSTFLYFYNCIY